MSTNGKLLDAIADELSFCDGLIAHGEGDSDDYRRAIHRIADMCEEYARVTGNNDYDTILKFAKSRRLVNLTAGAL